jgi:hypothetical protein
MIASFVEEPRLDEKRYEKNSTTRSAVAGGKRRLAIVTPSRRAGIRYSRIYS